MPVFSFDISGLFALSIKKLFHLVVCPKTILNNTLSIEKDK
jgi:hypothetical protein